MQEFFRQIIEINRMENDDKKPKEVQALFDRLNSMEMPLHFNWATQVFEDLHVNSHPDKTALIWQDLDGSAKQSYTYREMSQTSNQLLNYLNAAGMEKGDNLYLMTPLVPQTWFASLACIKGGIVTIPTAISMTVRALQFRFEIYPPKAIIANEASALIIDEALENISFEPKIKIVLGHKEGWASIEDIETQDVQAQGVQTGPEDFLFCFFTSGTTGLPKRVGHTAISYPLGHLSTTLMVGLLPEDIHSNLSAPGWAKWSWSSFFSVFNVGAAVTGFTFDKLDAERYLYAVEQNQVTSLCASPTAWRMFVDVDPENFDLSRLRQSLSAGEPLGSHVIETWERFTGHQIRDYYGQTETTAMIGNPPWMIHQMKKGSMGVPMGMYDVALADPMGNLINTPGQTGHIVVKLDRWRPAGLFNEYMGDPEKMHAVFVDHFYYTGDRASFDEEGYWWFEGRADDVIKSSDYRIGPFEVESALGEHPAVAEAAVVGAPDPKRHQLVKAYVILHPSYTGSRDLACELFKHTMHILPKFKIPRIIEFVPDVPKTMSGKIRRIDLRESEENRLDDPVADPETVAAEYFYWDFPELGSKNI
ncbi:MAG: acetyl-CoA synthetase [Desulfobacteraceae bacterium]|nr:MAG: acetyl-CoA synthetase [Desulfobacteraceae bacterium]